MGMMVMMLIRVMLVTMVLIYIEDCDDDYMTVTMVTLLMARSGCL